MSKDDFVVRRGLAAIARWREPMEGEPSYGFFLRLADAHRHTSMAAFAVELGINWVSAIEPGECLVSLCAAEAASEADRERLKRWTPLVRPTFSFVNGEQVRRDDFSLRTRRYCPACLAESAYHRVWFDLLFMGECPLHGVPIRDRPDGWEGTPALWTSVPLDSLVCGTKLSEPKEPLPPLAETLEGYALRRLGLAQARPDAFLDAFPLSDVFEAAELLGRFEVGGWQASMPLIGSRGFEPEVLRRRGWHVLRDGRGGVKACLARIAAKAPKRTFGARKLYGWGYYNLSFKSDLAHRLRDLMIEVAAERGVVGRRYLGGWRGIVAARKVADLEANETVSLNELAGLADGSTSLEDLEALAGTAVLLRDVARAVANADDARSLAGVIGRKVLLSEVAAIVGGATPLRDVILRLPECLTVREIALLIGESENAAISIGRARRLFLPHNGRKGSPFLTKKTNLASFLVASEAVVTRSEAVTMLGVPAQTFAEIVLAGHIEKFGTRWETLEEARERGGARAGAVEDRFEIAEIERFLDAIPLRAPQELTPGATVHMAPHVMTIVDMLAYTRVDAGDFFSAVAKGDVVVFTRLHRPVPRRSATAFAFEDALADFRIRLCDQRPGHLFAARWLSIAFTREQVTAADSLSQRQACALLDVNPATAKVLADLGYFKLLPSKDRCDRQKLDRASVEAFAAHYAAGKIYASALGCQDAKVPDRAKKAGVATLWEARHPDADLGRANAIFARDDMRRAFGWDQDPDALDPVRNGWKAMADRTGRETSLFSLWHVKPGISATFSTSDRLWPIDVSYVFGADVPDVGRHVWFDDARDEVPFVAYAIKATLDVGRKSGEERIDDFIGAVACGLPRGVEASVDVDEGRIRASMQAVIVVEDEGMSPERLFQRYAAEDAAVVALMLNTIKAAFESGARDFDPAFFGLWPVAFARVRRRGLAA